jgi:hypothetical protein
LLISDKQHSGALKAHGQASMPGIHMLPVKEDFYAGGIFRQVFFIQRTVSF